MTLDETLEIKQNARDKYNIACITINLTCHIIWSHKLDFWFIEKIAKSQYFGQLSINIKNF